VSRRDCIFCRVVAGEERVSFVYRDELVSAFMDSRPVTPGHLLVIPNEHVVCTHDLTDTTAYRLFSIGRRLARALRRTDAIQTDGTNFFVADGEAIQTVAHAHLHVIPRVRGDGFIVGPIPRREAESSRDRLDAIAAAIRDADPARDEPSQAKLVRDRIPELIRRRGSEPRIRQLSGDEFVTALGRKLIEEAEEVAAAPSVEELADVVEVVRALATALGLSLEDVEAIRQAKADARGAFKDRIVLESVDVEADDTKSRSRE
jgi:diadenosine tetraphosphate (Ap4A) HIT family hydrolase/predicted house-cleaning noncanonical NTP pyrophosphatase (MazG superfamily)